MKASGSLVFHVQGSTAVPSAHLPKRLLHSPPLTVDPVAHVGATARHCSGRSATGKSGQLQTKSEGLFIEIEALSI